MEITIKGKTYKCNFGVLFVKRMNDLHHINQEGVQLGTGLATLSSGILTRDVAILAEALYLACWNNANKSRPTQLQIDNFLDDPKTDIDKLFDEVSEALNESNATKSFMVRLKQALAQQQAQAKAEAKKKIKAK